jgi:hypothetical protein
MESESDPGTVEEEASGAAPMLVAAIAVAKISARTNFFTTQSSRFGVKILSNTAQRES